jgi:hypothetical protein
MDNDTSKESIKYKNKEFNSSLDFTLQLTGDK